MFTNSFLDYACCGDTIETVEDGFLITAAIEFDQDCEPPWANEDGHGPVSDWTTRSKRPGEIVLTADGPHKRFYDFQAAIKIAKEEKWDAKPYGEGTVGEQAVRAVTCDFQMMQAWCRVEWEYCGIVLSVSRNSVTLDSHASSLWGIELHHTADSNEYLTEVANELLDEAVSKGKKILLELCREQPCVK